MFVRVWRLGPSVIRDLPIYYDRVVKISAYSDVGYWNSGITGVHITTYLSVPGSDEFERGRVYTSTG
jgi:hypothetical protein